MWNNSFYEQSVICYRIAENFRVIRCFRIIRESFSAKFCEIRNVYVACVYADAMRMLTCARATPNWTGAIHESFLRKIFVLFQNAEVFSLALKVSVIIMIPIASALYKYLIMLSNCVINQNCGAATPYR